MSEGKKEIFWKVGSPSPPELAACKDDPFMSCLIPRTLAWFAVDDDRVCLLDGFTAGSYTPPSIICSAAALPSDTVRKLVETRRCTMSSATVREPDGAYAKVAGATYRSGSSSSSLRPSFAFDELGLGRSETRDGYPPAVISSPVHMHCTLERYEDLKEGGDDDDDDDDYQGLIVLVVEIFVIDGSVLSPATETMKTRPGVTAKIDADLIKPMVSLGQGRYVPLKGLRSMPRPRKRDDGTWESDPLLPVLAPPPSPGRGDFDTVEWVFRRDGGTSPLGYNAVTALVMPRPIGWISTYRRKGGKIPHIAPYSFFTDVSRGRHPMVAFSGFRRDNGATKKDAQQDAEDTGCFAYNMVTEDLAVRMNYSAAELGREESEFHLAGLPAADAALIDAPVVADAPVRFECLHVRSVDVGSFSVVIGRVQGIAVDSGILSEGGTSIDPLRAKPITRLGYMDEYGVI